MEIPLGHGEVMLAPKMEARMIQELGVRKTDKILEVGTGSGYVTALLAKLGGQVVTVERIKEFSQAATRRLAGHGIQNVQFHVGDASEGWPAQAPYDVILLTGSVPVLSESFQQQLGVGGRLLAVIGESPGDDRESDHAGFGARVQFGGSVRNCNPSAAKCQTARALCVLDKPDCARPSIGVPAPLCGTRQQGKIQNMNRVSKDNSGPGFGAGSR